MTESHLVVATVTPYNCFNLLSAVNSVQELRLIDILSCAVHQASTGEYPVGK